MKTSSAKPTKKPWPTKKAMVQIYEQNLWGGETGTFYSGSGSHESGLVDPYVKKVQHFLSSFDEPVTVADLGCGDFNVGRHFLPYVKEYIGVDIVPELIERNKATFKAEGLRFFCLDIAKDDLPDGDGVILRNVLQHLSNNEIAQILEKLRSYHFLILTEHIPDGAFTPNLDIISGQGIRLKKNSGVDITAKPFDLPIVDSEQWLSLPLAEWPGRIVTTLYRL